jgi:hypothetical protein
MDLQKKMLLLVVIGKWSVLSSKKKPLISSFKKPTIFANKYTSGRGWMRLDNATRYNYFHNPGKHAHLIEMTSYPVAKYLRE